MIDWEEHAEAIVERIGETVPDVRTVTHIKDAETDGAPATLPAVYVCMSRTGFSAAGGGRYDGQVTWQVLVRCKQMVGLTGALPVAGAVLSSLAGFIPVLGAAPLVPVSVEYFREEMRPEPAYVLTLTSSADHLDGDNINC